jgi:hypothetical protein
MRYRHLSFTAGDVELIHLGFAWRSARASGDNRRRSAVG